MTLFLLWNIKKLILKKIGKQTALGLIDFQKHWDLLCSTEKRNPF